MKQTKVIKFSGLSAAQHWGLDAATLSRRFKSAGIVPDANGLFSVRQVNGAVFGDQAGENLRLTKAKADREEHELNVARGQFVNLDEVRASWAEIVIVARSRLLALPSALASQLVGLAWPAIKNKLDDEIGRCLNEIADAPIEPPTAETIQNEDTK